MKKAIRIKTISQWYLLRQINEYFGKEKIPDEVLRKIYHILYSKKLGKDGFIVLCLNKIRDDYIGINESLNMYPYQVFWEEEIDKITTRTKRGKVREWYISYAKICKQGTKIVVIYVPKDCD